MTSFVYNNYTDPNYLYGDHATIVEDDTAGNTILSYDLSYNNTLGNVVIGDTAWNNFTGQANIDIGKNNLISANTKSGNVAIGVANLTLCTADNNIAIGSFIAPASSSGTKNIGIGTGALNSLTTGSNNICLGYTSGADISSNSNIVCVGVNTYANNNKLNINNMIFGDVSNNFTKIGINERSNIKSTLHVVKPISDYASLTLDASSNSTANDTNVIEFKSGKYWNDGLSGSPTRSNALFQLGLVQGTITSRDRFYIGRPAISSEDFVVNALSGNIGLGLREPSVQLDLSTDGARKLTTTTWSTGSDQRVKLNIEDADLLKCHYIIENLNLRRFQWNEKYYPNVDDRNVLGFIAQEVEKFYPKCVKTNQQKFLIQKGETEEKNIYEEIDDFKSLDIDQLIKCLFGAVKYLQKEVKELERSRLISSSSQPEELHHLTEGLHQNFALDELKEMIREEEYKNQIQEQRLLKLEMEINKLKDRR